MNSEITREYLDERFNKIEGEIRELKFEIRDVKSEMRALNSKVDTYQNVFYFGVAFIAIVTALAPFLYSILKALSSKPEISEAQLEPIVKKLILKSQSDSAN